MYGSRDNQSPSRFLKEMGFGIIKEPINAGYKSYNSEYSSYSTRTSGDYGYQKSYSSNSYNSTSTAGNFKTTSLSSLQGFMNNKLNSQKKSLDEYKVGVQVLHTKFGVGTIIKAEDVGGNNYVSVDFGTLGVKTLSLNLAPLQILKK